jgi:hypothetical protein
LLGAEMPQAVISRSDRAKAHAGDGKREYDRRRPYAPLPECRPEA